MDDLLTEFLAEAAEHIDAASMELVRIEKDPGDPALIASLFRHVHTIKGSSGFLSLPRVGRLAHGAEALIGRLRDGAKASGEHISLILAVVDRLSALLVEIGRLEAEPEGDDSDILQALEAQTKLLKTSEPPTLAPAWTAPAPEAEPGVSTAAGAAPSREAASATARSTETVRVSIGVLDRLMGIVSELVLTRNQLLELSADGGDERVKGSVQNLSSATSDLQDAVMRVRMQPLDKLFSTLPRLVRDLSLELRKKIRIETFGAETELDRQVIELMRAPLTHIIRNAADHGIESVAERIAAGKPETGLIRVTAAYDAGQITLEIKDDGRGFDVARIKKKARERGLASARALEKMTDAELYPLVLLPGFSTAEQVSKVSGRGVGMDVVRDNIHSIGGTVSLASRAGFGTTVLLRIPLTLAIAPALILSCGGSRFAIPQMAVVEVVGIGDGFESDVSLVYGAPMLRLRGEALPLACLAQTLGLAPPRAEEIGEVRLCRHLARGRRALRPAGGGHRRRAGSRDRAVGRRLGAPRRLFRPDDPGRRFGRAHPRSRGHRRPRRDQEQDGGTRAAAARGLPARKGENLRRAAARRLRAAEGPAAVADHAHRGSGRRPARALGRRPCAAL